MKNKHSAEMGAGRTFKVSPHTSARRHRRRRRRFNVGRVLVLNNPPALSTVNTCSTGPASATSPSSPTGRSSREYISSRSSPASRFGDSCMQGQTDIAHHVVKRIPDALLLSFP